MSGERTAGMDVNPGTEGVSVQTSYDPETIAKAVGALRPTPDQAFDMLNGIEEQQSTEIESIGLLEAHGETEEEAAPADPLFGKGVVSTEKSRAERARDSIGTVEDRRFERGYSYVAARAERHKLQRRGEKRHRPAADGYMPGNTPPKHHAWSMTTAHDMLLEEHGFLMGEDIPGITTHTSQKVHRLASLSSEAIHKVFAEREAEREAAAKQLTVVAFNAIEEAETALERSIRLRSEAEIIDFKVDEGIAPESVGISTLFTQASVREYQAFKGMIQGIGAKLHGGPQAHPIVEPAT